MEPSRQLRWMLDGEGGICNSTLNKEACMSFCRYAAISALIVIRVRVCKDLLAGRRALLIQHLTHNNTVLSTVSCPLADGWMLDFHLTGDSPASLPPNTCKCTYPPTHEPNADVHRRKKKSACIRLQMHMRHTETMPCSALEFTRG